MNKRIPLAQRVLPTYSFGEELLNVVSHIPGAVLGAVALVLCAAAARDGWAVMAAVIYGISLMALYTVSSVYHGLRPGMAKKVMQVIDHCTIYLLIAGSYTAVVMGALRLRYPGLAWGLFGFQWAMTALAVTLTAIDLKKYDVFSMICYIGMGWAVIPFWRPLLEVLTAKGFGLLLAGGIAYTVGAVLYGLGVRKKWMHSCFHIFVLLGSILQFLSVLGYAM